MPEYLFSKLNFNDWLSVAALEQLDHAFLHCLTEEQRTALLAYRAHGASFSATDVSDFIITLAPLLEQFLAEFFEIEQEVEAARLITELADPIMYFKKMLVLRDVKHRLAKNETLEPFDQLDAWLYQQLHDRKDMTQQDSPEASQNLSTPKITDKFRTVSQELAVAQLAHRYLTNNNQHATELERLTQWCIHILRTPALHAHYRDWLSFKLPRKIDFTALVPLKPTVNDSIERKHLDTDDPLRTRDGFSLTDQRMNALQVQHEAHYCIYCHTHEGDFCAKGFPVKKQQPELGFKKNALGIVLTGCPLEEKISEMNWLKAHGYTIAALATVMIDNPMCPATGHRICNDCMKSCIYQKQEPVNIPQIETRVLTDTLALPWGTEIYDLLTRWNPLRHQQYIAKNYRGLKVMIAGLGPAGFTLAHHLLMEGFAVVAFDGLKIEPLPNEWLTAPIRDFKKLTENLDERAPSGFGGVAEYGITVRWDKNFLKLIQLSLSRKPHFQAFGNVRLGGTVTVEDAQALGFHHLAIAVGAGLPRALPIPGSLATGMRQANDFLMALQLTGAFKKSSIANLQIRMPIIVIGGGLTGVDTATEAQTYYITQVEKCLYRYEILVQHFGAAHVHAAFDQRSLAILQEFIAHGLAVRQERAIAASEQRAVNFIPLLHAWGGVTIIYRQRIQDSPAYRTNPEELANALAEGIFYREYLDPKAVLLDHEQQVSGLLCHEHYYFAHGQWHTAPKDTYLPTKCILVATGARPNVAYHFEHEGTFARQGAYYQPFEWVDGQLHAVSPAAHCKVPDTGPFTSYHDQTFHVSFLGDTHPAFQGNVVKAIASAYRSYPKIVASLASVNTTRDDYADFSARMRELFHATIVSIERINHHTLSIVVKAPLAAQRFKPGQFYRLQNYATRAYKINDTLLQMEGIALAATRADPEQGLLYFSIYERGVSSRLAALFRAGDPVALMGPTGVRSKIPDTTQHHLIIGNEMAAVQALALGEKLQSTSCQLVFIGQCDESQQATLKKLCHKCIITDEPLVALRTFAQQSSDTLNLAAIARITVVGSTDFLRAFKSLRQHELQSYFNPDVKIYASVYSSMQCMLKGVCAQCLQWQIDPLSGERTKAVFACSWQHQPLELIDIDNIDERTQQNIVQERLTELWLDYLFEKYPIER